MKNRYRILTLVFFLLVICTSCEENKSVNNESNQNPYVQLQANVSGIEDGFEYVDLGLPSGIMWATYNVGANTPKDYGEYYAYGELEVKERYIDATYEEPLFTSGGTADMLPEYDVVRHKWGGKWRMPSVDEFYELRMNCSSTWGMCNGEYGCYLTGPNGNSLFLPATGYMTENLCRMQGIKACYQSSTKNEIAFYEVHFSHDYDNLSAVGLNVTDTGDNFWGMSVRPVMYLTDSKGDDQVVTGTRGGHDYVDLGLSVKWATCNVGADKPAEYGNYYKNEEYNDVIYNSWGDAWRKPSLDEFAELNACKWFWENRGGVKGYKIEGPNGNSIFLPAAGYEDNYGVSSLNYELDYQAFDGRMVSGWEYEYTINSLYTGVGYGAMPIRPVLREQTIINLRMDYCEEDGNTPAIKLNNNKVMPMSKNAGGEWEISFMAEPSDEFIFVSTSGRQGAIIEKYDEYIGWVEMQDVYTIGVTKHQVYDFSDVSKYRWRECGTQQSDDIELINGYACVDLGLSVKWATCNIGAIAAEELGDRFVWASTIPNNGHTPYIADSHPEYGRVYSKYWTNKKYGTVDNKTVLEPIDDAASSLMGGKWRMPTKEEYQELLEKCTWQMVVQNGRFGYKITGSNHNSIFLPCNNTPSYQRSTYYWSSSLDTSDAQHPGLSAYTIILSKHNHNMSSFPRSENYYEMYIRAVVPNNDF